jgi:hypothetical protein
MAFSLLIHRERHARLWASDEVKALSGGADEKPSVLHAPYILCCARLMNAPQRAGDGIAAAALIFSRSNPVGVFLATAILKRLHPA